MMQCNFDPAELEFIAEEELVEIVPRFEMDTVRMIGASKETSTYGPFKPLTRASVPLWMAVALKKRNKCNIVAPAWLSVNSLEDQQIKETNDGPFSNLPYRYLEISRVLLEFASDDIPSAERVRALLKDIREARLAKERDMVTRVDSNEPIENISSVEINEMRPFFSLAYKRLEQLKLDSSQMQVDEMY